ncbi:MAG: 2-amino-4-hydroxy-6-hydroxymethyldihydropteridine diphosphokinase [Acidimicrobiia bacterium]|nr:2-amino-4-hydroxy-6-hydroxymethyldihydropteridine diphosphokinase [Acidimicrobiia bacterium]
MTRYDGGSASTQRAVLGLGSNMGDRRANLRTAVAAIRDATAPAEVTVSALYETSPVGGPPQDDYLNAVVAFDTERDARELLELCAELENAAGRVREERFGPRTLDVDILLLGDIRVDEPDLVVPHPRMGERGFVLVPLADVAPERAEEPTDGWHEVHRVAVDWAL